MPDATSTVKVDGVEPSILVSLVDVKDNPERIKLFTADDGTERYLTKTGNAVLVTNKDLSILGGFSIDIEGTSPIAPTPIAETQNPPQETVVIPSPEKTTPGQTG